MAIKSVWIEEDCIACGTCEGICPEVFQVTARSALSNTINKQREISMSPFFI